MLVLLTNPNPCFVYTPRKMHYCACMKKLAAAFALPSLAFAMSGKFETRNPGYSGPMVIERFNAIPGIASGNFKMFHAFGTHVCWHENYAGHKCEVEGYDFLDANDAALRLKMDDCCPRTLLRGRSVMFYFNLHMSDLEHLK